MGSEYVVCFLPRVLDFLFIISKTRGMLCRRLHCVYKRWLWLKCCTPASSDQLFWGEGGERRTRSLTVQPCWEEDAFRSMFCGHKMGQFSHSQARPLRCASRKLRISPLSPGLRWFCTVAPPPPPPCHLWTCLPLFTLGTVL